MLRRGGGHEFSLKMNWQPYGIFQLLFKRSYLLHNNIWFHFVIKRFTENNFGNMFLVAEFLNNRDEFFVVGENRARESHPAITISKRNSHAFCSVINAEKFHTH